MKKLNFAVVGCGRVAPKHADAIIDLKNARLAAVCDVKKDRADHFAEKYKAKVYYSYEKLLKNPEIDIVNICTPSHLHSKMGIKAASAGKHVVVEKPMALNMQDANRLIRECKKSKVKLCVVLQNRFNPPMQDLKRLIDSGKLGKIFLASVCVRWFRPQEYYEDDWHGKRALDGGGVVMNQTTHHLDAIAWLLGMPNYVYSYCDTLAHNIEVEDGCVALFRYNNGPMVVFEASTFSYPENLEGSIALQCEKGTVEVGGTALSRKTIWKIKGELDKEKSIIAKETVDPPTVYGYSHKEVVKDMVNAVTDDRQPYTSGEEGKKSLKLVESIYKCVETKKEVRIHK